MNCLVVLAHPLENSLCRYLSEETISHLISKGYNVQVKDLYQDGFDPVLSTVVIISAKEKPAKITPTCTPVIKALDYEGTQ